MEGRQLTTVQVPVWTNAKSWKREMKWMHFSQTRDARQSARTQTRIQGQATVHVPMFAFPTCLNCIAL
jgi:hypothetical protein